jgi:hypothetical protein
MGILDEAIREHLDLKRRRGADAGELQQLEDEAFGPPTRPGEPDFPDRAEEGADGEAAAAAEAETAFMPADEAIAASDEVAVEEPEATAPATDEHAEASLGEPLPEEPAAEEAVGDETAFFDQAGDSQELELPDLELELDDELDQELGGRSLDQPPAEELPLEPDEAAADEPPIETFDTVEHRFEEAIEEPPPSDRLEPPSEEHPAGAAEGEGEEEDVLEETPGFLRDQPEDDELWFEQGEPKDFDF